FPRSVKKTTGLKLSGFIFVPLCHFNNGARPATPARRCALNSNASPFKKEPGQKQEGGKEDHGQSKGTRLLTRSARKIGFKTVPKPLPPRHFRRRPVKMKMRHDKLSAHSRSANSPCNPPAGQSLLKFCRARL